MVSRFCLMVSNLMVAETRYTHQTPGNITPECGLCPNGCKGTTRRNTGGRNGTYRESPNSRTSPAVQGIGRV